MPLTGPLWAPRAAVLSHAMLMQKSPAARLAIGLCAAVEDLKGSTGVNLDITLMLS